MDNNVTELKDDELKQVCGGDRVSTSNYEGLKQFYAYKNKTNSSLYGLIKNINPTSRKVEYITATYDGVNFTSTNSSYKKSIETFKNLYITTGAIKAYSFFGGTPVK
ncbi:MAG: hypothetical protein Q4F12_04540 [Erysipelotrichaceae bacterium]|nr:hypothetical protein [Erysipelotrichaceae bacterium]